MRKILSAILLPVCIVLSPLSTADDTKHKTSGMHKEMQLQHKKNRQRLIASRAKCEKKNAGKKLLCAQAVDQEMKKRMLHRYKKEQLRCNREGIKASLCAKNLQEKRAEFEVCHNKSSQGERKGCFTEMHKKQKQRIDKRKANRRSD